MRMSIRGALIASLFAMGAACLTAGPVTNRWLDRLSQEKIGNAPEGIATVQTGDLFYNAYLDPTPFPPQRTWQERFWVAKYGHVWPPDAARYREELIGSLPDEFAIAAPSPTNTYLNNLYEEKLGVPFPLADPYRTFGEW